MSPLNAVLVLLAQASWLRGGSAPANASGHAAANHSLVRRVQRQKYKQQLANFQNTQYYGEITVGGQLLHGIFDTGSFELLVLSARCTSCQREGPFDHTRSPTYRAANGDQVSEFHFGSGPVLTVQGYDTVQMGPYTVGNMPIWEIVDHNIPVIEVSALDAIVGIGPGAKDRQHESLMDEFGITRYSVCLLPQDQAPGFFIWQDDDPRTRPGFVQVPVVGEVHWGVALQNVRVGDVTFACSHGCGAVLDSGTSLIAAPHASLEHLASALDHLNPDCSNMAEMPSLKFEIGGQTTELPPQAYIARMVGVIPPSIWDVLTFKPEAKVVMQCVPLLMDLERMQTKHGPLWILGMPFFRFYYTTFSFETRQVHIARASSSCDPLPGVHGQMTELSMLSHQAAAPITINPATLRVPKVEDESF
jgi:hypothetical protein